MQLGLKRLPRTVYLSGSWPRCELDKDVHGGEFDLKQLYAERNLPVQELLVIHTEKSMVECKLPHHTMCDGATGPAFSDAGFEAPGSEPKFLQ